MTRRAPFVTGYYVAGAAGQREGGELDDEDAAPGCTGTYGLSHDDVVRSADGTGEAGCCGLVQPLSEDVAAEDAALAMAPTVPEPGRGVGQTPDGVSTEQPESLLPESLLEDIALFCGICARGWIWASLSKGTAAVTAVMATISAQEKRLDMGTSQASPRPASPVNINP